MPVEIGQAFDEIESQLPLMKLRHALHQVAGLLAATERAGGDSDFDGVYIMAHGSDGDTPARRSAATSGRVLSS